LRRASDKSGDAESSEAQVLRLQSQAGNRAVTSLLTGQGGPQVQREIPFAENLAFASVGGKVASVRVKGSYAKLVKAVRKYHEVTEIADKLRAAEVIAGLCDIWLDKHKGPLDPDKSMQKYNIENLIQPEAKKSVAVLRGQIAYAAGLEKEAKEGGFEGLSDRARTGAIGPARQVYAGEAPDPTSRRAPFKGTGQETINIVAEFGLLPAELAAIRVYTMADYIYINAAITGTEKETVTPEVSASLPERASSLVPSSHRARKKNVAAVEKKIAQSKDTSLQGHDPKVVAEEGAAHAGMIVMALNKLPKYEKPVFRGLRLSAKEFDDYFNGDRITSRPQFSSSTKSPKIAEDYADGKGDSTPRPDQTISVFCTILTENARDVEKLSAAQINEKEVLFFPGVKFLILDKTPESTGRTGVSQAPATAWWNVTLVELKPF
jgi:hypothetical protein